MKDYHWLALQVKPAGDCCNLDCAYCYNSKLQSDLNVMPKKVLESVLKKYIDYSPQHLIFSWHGGEPLVAGLPFYQYMEEKLEELIKPEQTVFHMMQTNGVLIDNNFARLFKRNKFNVGVSLDGPEEVHSLCRVFGNGLSSYHKVMKGVDILRDNGVEPSIICTVTKKSYRKAKEILEFFVKNGFYNLSFSPVAYIGKRRDKDLVLGNDDWLFFLKDLFYAWCGYNNSKLQIRELNEIFAWTIDRPLSLCSNGKNCTHWLSVNFNGDVSACEYYNWEKSFGNVLTDDFGKMLVGENFLEFASGQRYVNPVCGKCEFLGLCGNGCSKMRILGDKFDIRGKYLYCEQRKQLYSEIKDHFDRVKLKRGGEK